MITAMPVALTILSEPLIVSKKNKSTRRLSFAQLKILGLAVCILSIHSTVFSQLDTAQQKPAYDSLKTISDSLETKYDSAINKLFGSIKEFGTEEAIKNINEYKEDVIATRQDEIIEEIRSLMLEAKSYLENGLDTTGLNTDLNKIEHWYDVTSDGVFTHAGTIQTLRNLQASYRIMKKLKTRASERKSSVDNYYKNLVVLRNKIDSLYKDSVLYEFSPDSTVLMRYVKKLIVLSQEIRPIDSSLKQTLASVSEFQPTVTRLVNKLNSSIEQIEIFQKELSNRTFNRETPNLGGPVRYSRPFAEVINFSMIKGGLAFAFYGRDEINRIFLVGVLVFVSAMFLVNLKRKLRSQNMLDKDARDQVVLKYPVLSAIVIILTLFQFIFPDPPFIFNALLWTLSAVALTIVFRKSISTYWLFAWFTMLTLFLFASADNLVLQASRIERWIMLALSVAGIVSGSIILLMGHRRELNEKLVVYFVGFVIIMQVLSIVSNTYGRYNFSKTCLTSGFFNVILATLFLWTLRLINQSLSLASKAYRIPGKKLFNINFERIGDKAPRIFYVLLLIGWFILFARNFYAYKLIADPIENFILKKRSIGEFSFTIGTILEFFLILYLAGLTSRIVSYFALTAPDELESSTRKGGLGSWLLIIRIAIVSIGLLLAFAAVGIPMDRLTIILSALSVGIGFGLQSLVNNLVSGLIISFEKPVNIGDIVEIEGHSGTIKSIGFRSSILSTPTGAEVVIPNGELLNQHLVNWTHNNNFRCVDIQIGVAYGTNLERTIQILESLPSKDQRILSNPPPGVTIRQFNSSSIDMQLSFWVGNLRQWPAVKSDIILAIDRAFRENKIEIPLPQQDIHIRSVAKEEIAKKSNHE